MPIRKFASLAAFCFAASLGLPSAAQVTDENVIAEVSADPANWREVPAENLFVFETTKGRVLIEAFPEIAPQHVAQFRQSIASGLYDGTVFHRVIDGFMAQGGDIEALKGEQADIPNLQAEFTFRRDPKSFEVNLLGNDQNSRNGYYKGVPIRTQSQYLAELSADGQIESWIPHCPGVVSTARVGGQPNSAKFQFFLLRATSDFLDKQYTAWGRMVEGLRVARALKEGEPVENPDTLVSARVASQIPEDERPKVWVRRTDGPEFKAGVLSTSLGEDDVCDLPQVASVVQN